MLAVVASGFFIIGSFATTIVLAQTMLPDNVGMAAGLTIGFSVGMGGFGVTILGFIADNFGLPLVMQIVTWLPVAAAIIALKIPIPASLRNNYWQIDGGTMESTFRQGIIYSLTAYLLWGILPIYWKTLGVVQAFEILSNRFIWSCVLYGY